MSIKDLVDGVLQGNRLALARLISLIENEDTSAPDALSQLYKHTGHAHIIGVTGPPGSGKSTIVTKMITEYRKRGKKVGIIAVDPSSPFTGGALLGDRIRMQEHSLDKDVYVRSMGTRGHLGGIARATSDVVRAIDAFGKDIIIVETVGAGQAEVEIVKVAHTIIVTDVPSSGDEIQAIKAGIMEIADIFVVNKMDLPGADEKVRTIKAMQELDTRDLEWTPPVMLTLARSGEGIVELVDMIEKHLDYLNESGLMKERGITRSKEELESLMEYKLTQELLQNLQGRPEFTDAIKRIAKREEDPYTVAERLIVQFLSDYREESD